MISIASSLENVNCVLAWEPCVYFLTDTNVNL